MVTYGPICAVDAERGLAITVNGAYLNIWNVDGPEPENFECRAMSEDLYKTTGAQMIDLAEKWLREITIEDRVRDALLDDDGEEVSLEDVDPIKLYEAIEGFGGPDERVEFRDYILGHGSPELLTKARLAYLADSYDIRVTEQSYNSHVDEVLKFMGYASDSASAQLYGVTYDSIVKYLDDIEVPVYVINEAVARFHKISRGGA
jgi:hypothetical protein